MASDTRVHTGNRERFLFILLAQLPILAVLASLVVIVGISEPEALTTPAFVVAIVLAVGVSIAAVRVHWDRFRRPWIVVVPIADIIIVALAREGLNISTGTVPAFGALVIFPVLWLATEFSMLAFPAVFVASALVVALPYVLHGSAPEDAIAWFNLVLVPLAMGCVALAAGYVVKRMHEDRRRADELAVRLQDSLEDADNREVTLRSVTETVEAAIVMFDVDGAIVLRNGTARSVFRLAGATDDGAFTSKPLIFLEDRVTPAVTDPTIFSAVLGEEELAGRIYWLGASGSQRAITVASRRVTRPDGGVLGTVVVGYDVTALVESIEVRDAFLSSVSHELKTPLTNILGYVDLIRDSNSTAEVAVIRKNANRLLGLVSDLLTGTGTTEQVYRLPADLTAIAESALTDVQTKAEAADIRLRLAQGLRVMADVDAQGLRRVLDHLLSNAINFSTPGGTIVVEVAEQAQSAVITVTDSGPGISAAHQRQVFERFFRAPLARSEAIQGAGLGLAVVKALVEAHEGTVTVQSEPGAGSVFTVRVPLRAGATRGVRV